MKKLLISLAIYGAVYVGLGIYINNKVKKEMDVRLAKKNVIERVKANECKVA